MLTSGSVDRADAPNISMIALALVTCLFFLWALAHNLNDVLIKQFQLAFGISRTTVSLIQVAFYAAYFIFPLPAAVMLRRLGYKRTLIVGLALYATGTFAFVPAAWWGTFPPFLIALFVMATGVLVLEMTASAVVVAAGRPDRADFRINFCQGFNGLGSIVAPLIGALAILPTSVLHVDRAAALAQVRAPYVAMGSAAVLFAIALWFVHLPDKRADGAAGTSPRELLRQWPFRAALVAQFLYVGAQIGSWSFFIDYAANAVPSMGPARAAFWLSLSLTLFMIGRFAGAALMTRFSAGRVLTGYVNAAIAASVASVLLPGWAGLGALVALGGTLSVIFPTIYGFALEQAPGAEANASAMMIMMIVGGAVTPPLMGIVADSAGIRAGYVAIVLALGAIRLLLPAFSRR